MVLSLLNITRDSILAPLGLLPYSSSFIFELIDMLIMSLAIGYIFSGFLKKPVSHDYDPLKHYQKSNEFEELKLGIMIAAPAVVFHELAHKFVAMAFDMDICMYILPKSYNI